MKSLRPRIRQVFFLHVAFVLAISLSLAQEASLSPSDISAIKNHLESDDAEAKEAALEKLSGLAQVPDDLIDVILKSAMNLASSTVSMERSAGKKPSPEDLIRLLPLSEVDQLWPKMSGEKLSVALRPYFKDEKVRSYAGEIASHNPKAAGLLIPELCLLLDENDDNCVYWASKALSRLGPEGNAAIPKLIGLLSNQRESIQESAAKALDSFTIIDNRYVPALINGLGNSNLSVRESSAMLLKKISFDPASQMEALFSVLDKTRFSFDSIDLLVKIGPPVIKPLLEHAAKASFESIDDYLCVLRKMGPESAKALAPDLNSDNLNLRYMAVDMALEFPSEDQKKPEWIAPYLKDPDKNIRIIALTYWVKFQTDNSAKIDFLGNSLNDPDLQETAVNLAADQRALALPLAPQIQAIIDKTSDDRTKIEYLADYCVINAADSKPYNQLVEYLHSPDEDLASAAVYALISVPELRDKSKSVIKALHDNQQTPDAVRREIDRNSNFAGQ